MSMANRDQAIIDFQEKSGINILIVSLKAAALGLNLVAANHVVLLDLVSSLFIWTVCSDLLGLSVPTSAGLPAQQLTANPECCCHSCHNNVMRTNMTSLFRSAEPTTHF